jgi:hypothetical protein
MTKVATSHREKPLSPKHGTASPYHTVLSWNIFLDMTERNIKDNIDRIQSIIVGSFATEILSTDRGGHLIIITGTALLCKERSTCDYINTH